MLLELISAAISRQVVAKLQPQLHYLEAIMSKADEKITAFAADAGAKLTALGAAIDNIAADEASQKAKIDLWPLTMPPTRAAFRRRRRPSPTLPRVPGERRGSRHGCRFDHASYSAGGVVSRVPSGSLPRGSGL